MQLTVFWHFKDVIKIVWFFQYHFSKWAKWLVYQCFDKEKMLPSIYFVGPFVKLYLILTKDLGSLSGQKSQKLRKTVLWPNVTSPSQDLRFEFVFQALDLFSWKFIEFGVNTDFSPSIGHRNALIYIVSTIQNRTQFVVSRHVFFKVRLSDQLTKKPRRSWSEKQLFSRWKLSNKTELKKPLESSLKCIRCTLWLCVSNMYALYSLHPYLREFLTN